MSVPPHIRTDEELAWGRAMLRLLNRQRTAHSLEPLRMRPHLLTSARRHNLRMAQANTLTHKFPDEPDISVRIPGAGYTPWTYLGENIAWDSEIDKTAVLMLQRLMYRERPPENGHRLNILSHHYAHVGIDIFIDDVHGRLWVTQDFGHH